MSLFDQIWTYANDQLSCIKKPTLLVHCKNGLIMRSAAGSSGPDDVDRVMDALGFDRVPGASSSACLVYQDRENRRLDNQIRFGFGFPPIGLHWEVIRKQVDIWFAGPADGPAWID